MLCDEAWNEALGYHQKARNNSLQEGFKAPNFTTFNGLEIEEIKEYNLKMPNNEEPPKNMEKFPLNYMLFCRKR